MFRVPPESIATLESLQSSYRVTHTRLPIYDENGKEQRDSLGQTIMSPNSICIGEVVDLVTKKPYAQGSDHDELQAVLKAIDVAKTATRPMSPAEMSQENQAQKDEIAQLRAALAEHNIDVPEEESELGAGYNKMSSSQLISELDTRDIEVPTGDKRKIEWKRQVVGLLETDDDGSTIVE